jgi:hypothetical protein
MPYFKSLILIIAICAAVLVTVPTQATAAGVTCNEDNVGKSCPNTDYVCKKKEGSYSTQYVCVCRWGYFESIQNLPGLSINSDICAFMATAGGTNTEKTLFILNIIVAIMTALVVFIAMGSIVIGGYIYMTAGGSADRIQQAKVWIGAAILGIIIAFSAWIILALINPSTLQV